MSGREGAPGSAAPRAASDRARSLGQVILLLAALFGAYANALRAEFVYDDIAVVRDNPRIRDLRNIPHFFTTSYWAASGSLDAPVASGLYRPLVQTSFALEYALWGGRPSGFHLTNVALHAAFTLLLWSGLAALRLAPGLPFLAALLFGLHPVHTEAVTSVVGRAEILCGLFSLLSLCAYAAWYRRAPRDPVGRLACAAALVAYALALLSKEMAAIVPVLALLLEPLLAAAPVAAVASAPPPEAVAAGATRFSAWARGVARRQAGYLLVLTAYMIVRSWAIGGVAPGTPPLEALHIPGGQRVLLMAQVFGDYVRLMVLPAPLLAVHRCNSVRAAMLADFAQPATWFGLLALAGAAFTVWVAVRRGRPGVAVGVAWFYLALLPVSNLLVPIGVIYSERALYLPSVGPCVLLAGLIFALAGRVAAPGTRRLLLLALPALGLLVPWAAMTRARNEVWRTQATLFQDLVERDPQNPRNWLGLAQVALDGGRLDEGLGLYDQAVALGANDPFTRRNRGMLHLTAGRARLAEADLTAALAGLPAGSRAAVSVRLGRAAARRALGDPAGAHDDLAAAAAAAPDDPDVCVAYGESWMRSGRPAAALSWFERAVARAPRNGAAHVHRAFALEALGRFAEAWDALAPALELPAPLPARAGVLRDLLRVELGRELEAAAPALDAATAGDSALAARALAPLARAWLTLGRPEAAREAVRRLRALGVVVPADLEGLDRR